MNKWGGFLKSGNYLSSQQYLASTFGVKELNFCVRNENRWDLFAIITAMVIYSALAVYIRFYTSFEKTNNYIANILYAFCKIFIFFIFVCS